MERGYIVDATHGGSVVGRWSAGVPRKSFWTGIKPAKAEAIPMGVFRCASCGFLESYARDEFAAI
jgi:hypothetical protein